MIFDADVHLSPKPQPSLHVTTDALLRRMDAAGVDRALAWLQPPYERGELPQGNRYVHEAAQAHPDRLVPFGWSDPSLGRERSIDAVKQCLDEFGFPGVKFNGAQNGYPIDSDVAMPAIEAVVERGGMLAFHIGVDELDKTNPWRMANLARRFPQTTFLLVHIGGVAFNDMSRLAVDCVAELPNVHAIGSAVRPAGILYAIQRLGAGRVMFGSDTPFEFMDVELAKYRALLRGRVSDADAAKVLGGNAQRLFARNCTG